MPAEIRDARAAAQVSWAGLVTGRKRLVLIRERVASNEDVVEAYQEEYELAKRSLLDLLDAERALFLSRFELASVDAVYKFSAHQLLASMGVLLESLRVSAPAEARADHLLQSQQPLGMFNIEIDPLRQ